MSTKSRYVSEVAVGKGKNARAVRRLTTVTRITRLQSGLSLVLLPARAKSLALPPGTLMWPLGEPSRFDALDQTLERDQVEQVDKPAAAAHHRRHA